MGKLARQNRERLAAKGITLSTPPELKVTLFNQFDPQHEQEQLGMIKMILATEKNLKYQIPFSATFGKSAFCGVWFPHFSKNLIALSQGLSVTEKQTLQRDTVKGLLVRTLISLAAQDPSIQ
jgi:hypothetical protein